MRYNFTKISFDAATRPLRYVLIVALLAVFFGYDIGALFLNENFLAGYYILNTGDMDVIVGTVALGILFGYFLGGYLAYGSGRKICIISGSGLGSLAITASFFAPSVSVMLCAQFVIGFAFGLYLLAALLYVHEITLPGNRGLAACAVFCALILGGLVAVFTRGNIPVTGGFLIILSLFLLNFIILVLSIFKIPESPRFLAISGVPDSALPILFKLRLDMGVAARELAGINECCRQEERGSELFLQSANFRRLIWLLLTVTLLINLSGFVLIPYSLADLIYAADPDISFKYYDFYSGVLKSGMIVAFAGLLTAMMAIDRIGRRRTIILGISIGIVSLVFLLVLSIVDLSRAVYFVSAFVLLFIFAASLVLPSFFCVLAAELIPTRAREFGLTLVLMFNVIIGLGSMQLFSPLIIEINFSGLFTLCLIFAVLLLILVAAALPNTAASSLEGIESRLLSGRQIKDLGKIPEI